MPTIISHHTPMYFVGCIHDVSSSLHGSLRLRMSFESRAAVAVEVTITVRHGEWQGAIR